MVQPYPNPPATFSRRFWQFSKYLVPLDRHALNLFGAAPPREVATFDQMADRYPELVQTHELGIDHDWGEFPFQTLRDGQLQMRTAHAEPPFRLRVVSLQQSSCIGRHCCVLGPNQTLNAEFGYYLDDNDRRNKKRFKEINPQFLRARWLLDLRYRHSIPKPQKLPGTAVLLNNPWCHNYYHWMLEVAPRLMMVRQTGLQPDWYVVDCQSRYQRRALELLGVPSDRIIQPHYALHLQADTFLRPSHPGLGAWQAMAETICQAVAESDVNESSDQDLNNDLNAGAISYGWNGKKSYPKRIYISRRLAAHRKVVNEPELEAFLEARGFQACVFEELDFAQQVRLIRNADVIVAVHGAALANLIFARQGTRIVEICPANRYNTDCFPRISHKFGHQHIAVLTPSTRFGQNLSVNLSDIDQALAWCGLGQAEGRGTNRANVA